MFTINCQTNRITAVRSITFSELGFSERTHLQEWLAHEPSALGEELLIIQKEFDGFDETRERLDLLALDKDGNLVIIENKLDDSGRDVVWQALKYASYCANLTKLQIIDIYQKYLQRFPVNSNNGESKEFDASAQICEFLAASDIDEVKLNLGNSQRIMLVAANFRKEVTNTALWLFGRGISIQCFKVTPHVLGDQLLINIDQIVPISEATELMIGLSAKEAEEKSTEIVLKNRHNLRQKYWEQLLELFLQSKCTLYNNISPGKDHWLSAGSGLRGCPYNLIFSQKELRVELWISRGSTDENKFIFDFLSKNKNEIEINFGKDLEWQRLDNKKGCRIQSSWEIEGFDKEKWPEYFKWHLDSMTQLEKAFNTPLQHVADALRKRSWNKNGNSSNEIASNQ